MSSYVYSITHYLSSKVHWDYPYSKEHYQPFKPFLGEICAFGGLVEREGKWSHLLVLNKYGNYTILRNKTILDFIINIFYCITMQYNFDTKSPLKICLEQNLFMRRADQLKEEDRVQNREEIKMAKKADTIARSFFTS